MVKRVLFLFLSLSSIASAQDSRPVVALLPFESVDTSAAEKKTVENLVQSYVSELGDFRLVTQADREKALSEQEFAAAVNDPSQNRASDANSLLTAHFLLSGSIGTLGDERVLTLEAVKVKTGEKKSVSSIYKSMSDLALGVRSLVLRVFERNDAASNSQKTASVVKEENLVGTWRGDRGIELVRIFRGGKAFAVFTSGAQMELSYRIDGSEIRFTQTSRNVARFYHPVPYAVALDLVKIARPMEWDFRLAEDGSSLKGTKTATAVAYEGSKIKEIIKEAKRDAEWTKSDR